MNFNLRQIKWVHSCLRVHVKLLVPGVACSMITKVVSNPEPLATAEGSRTKFLYLASNEVKAVYLCIELVTAAHGHSQPPHSTGNVLLNHQCAADLLGGNRISNIGDRVDGSEKEGMDHRNSHWLNEMKLRKLLLHV
ncbi:hypothetical protein EVAR_73756_1, partial [Eumeta japonica]